MGLIVVLGIASSVAAYTLWGWFNTSAIDTDGNSQADLSVCYDTSTTSPIYVNRAQVDQEIERWHGAAVGSFSSNGICNNDGSNIRLLQQDLGHCEAADHGVVSMTLGFFVSPGNTGYSTVTVFYNSDGMDDFDWYDNDGIDPNKWSALAVGLHEVGHTLGLKHSSVANAVMNQFGPDNCDWFEHDLGLAFDDADGYRDRYPGIQDTASSFPASALCYD